MLLHECMYSKTCVKRPLCKRPKIGFQDQLSPNAGQKYCRMLQGEHSAILSTFIRLPFVIKIFVCLILSDHFTQVLLYLFLTLLHPFKMNVDCFVFCLCTFKFGILFCKQYGHRSDRSHGSSLIRVHTVCYHPKSCLEVH